MNTLPDWPTLFQNAGTVPGTSSTSTGQRWVVRAPYVDLGDLLQQVEQASPAPLYVQVYADVIHLPDGMQWPIASNTGLVLSARLIEVAGSATVVIDCRTSQVANATVFAGAVVGSLQATVATGGSASTSFQIDQKTSLGVTIGMDAGAAAQTALATPDSQMLVDGSPQLLSLVTSFTYATLWMQSDPTSAGTMFAWVQAMTAACPDVADLYTQAAAAGGILAALSTDSAYVPALSATVYTQLASAYVSTATAIEAQMQTVIDNEQSADTQIAAAKAMLASTTDKAKLAQSLISQQAQAVAAAQTTSDQASALLSRQGAAVAAAQLTFNNGLAQYQANSTISGLLTLYGAVFDLAAALPGCFLTGNPQEEITKILIASEGMLQEYADTAAAMKWIAGALGSLSKLLQISRTVAAATKSFSSMKELPSLLNGIGSSDVDGQNLLATAQWQVIQLEADKALSQAVALNVPGASDYQLALDKLVVYGLTCVSAQVQYVVLSQQLAKLEVEQYYTQRQANRLNAMIASLQSGIALDDDALQQLFLRSLAARRWLFLAFENYCLSYQYWALQPSSITPSMRDDAATLQANLASIEQDRIQGLLSFKPQPLNTVIDITDPDVIAALQTTGTASFPLTLDTTAFAGWDRVRLKKMRFWIEGLTPPTGQPVYVSFSTSNTYLDRLQGQDFTFTTQPLAALTFEYHVNQNADDGWPFADGSYGHVDGDGAVIDTEQYAYIEPTPFTTWTLTLPATLEPGLDLSGITAIHMQIAGSGVAQSQ